MLFRSEKRAVRVHARDGRLAVKVIYEALRSGDPLKDAVRRAHQMAAEDKNPSLPIRVLNAQDRKPRTPLSRVADVVQEWWRRKKARRLIPSHETGDPVRTVPGGHIACIKCLPRPPASDSVRRPTATCWGYEGPSTRQDDLDPSLASADAIPPGSAVKSTGGLTLMMSQRT